MPRELRQWPDQSEVSPGNKYFLVICDFTTRYPEMVPLKSINAESVAEELIKVFARVGVPREILTDQEANFTSQLLAELYTLLQVHPIRISLYHPQTTAWLNTLTIGAMNFNAEHQAIQQQRCCMRRKQCVLTISTILHQGVT